MGDLSGNPRRKYYVGGNTRRKYYRSSKRDWALVAPLAVTLITLAAGLTFLLIEVVKWIV